MLQCDAALQIRKNTSSIHQLDAARRNDGADAARHKDGADADGTARVALNMIQLSLTCP